MQPIGNYVSPLNHEDKAIVVISKAFHLNIPLPLPRVVCLSHILYISLSLPPSEAEIPERKLVTVSVSRVGSTGLQVIVCY